MIRVWERPIGLGMTNLTLLRREGLPVFNTDHINLDALMEEGNRIAEEQAAVARVRLAGEYMNNTGTNRGQAMLGMTG